MIPAPPAPLARRGVLGMLAPRDRARLVGPIADGDADPVLAARAVHAAIAWLLRGERVHRCGGGGIAFIIVARALRYEDHGDLSGAVLGHAFPIRHFDRGRKSASG